MDDVHQMLLKIPGSSKEATKGQVEVNWAIDYGGAKVHQANYVPDTEIHSHIENSMFGKKIYLSSVVR